MSMSSRIMYGVAGTGDLLWYRHLGQEDGTFHWQGPKKVGDNWSGFSQVFAGTNGVVYGITHRTPQTFSADGGVIPPSGGDLLWYRHLGQEDGTFHWQGPKKVGDNWSGFSQVFAAPFPGADQFQPGSGPFWAFLDVLGTPQVGLLSYGLAGSHRTQSLTWSASGTANGVGAGAFQAELTKAFRLWASASPQLNFTFISSGHADISVVTGNLGGRDPITGSLTLAHTEPDGSRITFNSNPSATFVGELPGANSVLQVATHEIGHAIGILHSTTPGMVMYPFTSPATETLGIEDIAAVRALYAWSQQSPVPGIGTAASPALCVCGESLVMAWRGSGDDAIWSSRSTDGVTWTPQRQVPGTGTTDGPALAWDGKLLWLAIRGVSDDDALYWATSADLGVTWSPVQQVAGAGSACAPSMTINAGTPLLTWRGVPSDDRLYFTTWNKVWNPPKLIGGAGSLDRPSVCMGFDGLPHMVWRGGSGDDSLYTSSLVGLFWEPQQQLSWIMAGNQAEGTIAVGVPGSKVGPSITNGDTAMYLAWQGVAGDDRIYFTQATGGPGGQPPIEWSSQVDVPGAGTSHRPCIVTFHGQPFIAWKGASDDHTIYTSRQVIR